MSAMIRLLVVAFALMAASPAMAASFDCKTAVSQVDKLICGDPELSRQDEALAKVYAEALKAWDGQIAVYTRASQRAWARSRSLVPEGHGVGGQPCFDDKERLPCLRGMYRERIAVLSSPAWRLGGVYERGKDILRLTPGPGGIDFAYMLGDAAASQGFTPDGKPVRIAVGQEQASFVLAGTGRDACRLDGAFTADQVTITQTGPCGGKSLGGWWKRNPARDPLDEMF